MISKIIKIDLSYIRPESAFIYPLYSDKGEKLLNARVAISSEQIKDFTSKYGNTLFYTDTGEGENIPDYKKKIAYNRSMEIMEEINKTDKLSKHAYGQAEEIIEMLLSDLTSSEIESINLLKDLKSHEEYIYTHSVNVGILSAIFALKLDIFSLEEIKSITLGAYLHDIGEMKIESQLLNKKGKLNYHEIKKIRRHPQLSYEILKNISKSNRTVHKSVLFHHERYNNRGYYMLPYTHLPIYPKIISICDIFDALTSKRPFRGSISPSNALRSIVNSTGIHFHHSLISDFINKLGPILNNTQSFYTTNEICELNTQELALIKGFGIENLLKPNILVFCRFTKERGKLIAKFYNKPLEVDLNDDPTRIVTKILSNKQQVNTIKDKLLERTYQYLN